MPTVTEVVQMHSRDLTVMRPKLDGAIKEIEKLKARIAELERREAMRQRGEVPTSAPQQQHHASPDDDLLATEAEG